MRDRLRALWAHLRSESSDPTRLAAAVFVGVFLGVVPLYGIQTGICLVAAHLLRLNKLTVIAAAQVSMPFFAPFLIGGSIVIGEFLRFGSVRIPTEADGLAALQWTSVFSGGLPDIVVSCFVGSVVLGAALGASAAGVVYALAVRRDVGRTHETVVDGRDDRDVGVQRGSRPDSEW